MRLLTEEELSRICYLSGALSRFAWAMERMNGRWGEEAQGHSDWLFELVKDLRGEKETSE